MDSELKNSLTDSVGSDETKYAQMGTVVKKNRIVKLHVEPCNLRGAPLPDDKCRDWMVREEARIGSKPKESGPKAKKQWMYDYIFSWFFM